MGGFSPRGRVRCVILQSIPSFDVSTIIQLWYITEHQAFSVKFLLLVFAGSTHFIFVSEACTMIFDPQMSVYNICDRSYHPFADNIHFSRSVLASSSAWLPLLYDTAVLVLIAYKTLPALRFKNRYSIMKRLLEDGLIYYT
jgi:hypothetical protein